MLWTDELVGWFKLIDWVVEPEGYVVHPVHLNLKVICCAHSSFELEGYMLCTQFI